MGMSEDTTDAIRYRWLREKLANGEETYIGEWLTSESRLDEYIDDKIKSEIIGIEK